MILLSSAHSIMSFKAINITFFPTSCDSLIRKSCEEQTIPENLVDRKQHFRSVLVSPGESVVVCGDASPSDEISFSSPFSSADVDSPKKKPKSTSKSTSQPPSSPVLIDVSVGIIIERWCGVRCRLGKYCRLLCVILLQLLFQRCQ